MTEVCRSRPLRARLRTPESVAKKGSYRGPACLPCAAPEDRCTDFRLIEGTYCTEDAVTEAGYFLWEEDRMYTKRESELIQQHLSQYGELPGGAGDELDDLF